MQDSNILWYRSYNILNNPEFHELQDFQLYKHFHDAFPGGISAVDRSGTIKFPVIQEPFEPLKLPEYEKMSMTYEDVCLQNAERIMDKAKNDNKKIHIMYSGGIDSSLVVAAFFLACSREDIRDWVVVLLDYRSIIENPEMYNEVLLPYFNCKSSAHFTKYFLRDDVIIVHGECNDQLFGHGLDNVIVMKLGFDFMYEKGTDDNIQKVLEAFSPDGYLEDVHERIVTPLIDNAYDPDLIRSEIRLVFWWMNMTLKFQNVYYRMQQCRTEDSEYKLKNDDTFLSFFTHPSLSLWSMNNTDKFLNRGLKLIGIKWPSKLLIDSILSSRIYLNNKRKVGSLGRLVKGLRGEARIIYENETVSTEKISPSVWKAFT